MADHVMSRDKGDGCSLTSLAIQKMRTQPLFSNRMLAAARLQVILNVTPQLTENLVKRMDALLEALCVDLSIGRPTVQKENLYGRLDDICRYYSQDYQFGSTKEILGVLLGGKLFGDLPEKESKIESRIKSMAIIGLVFQTIFPLFGILGYVNHNTTTHPAMMLAIGLVFFLLGSWVAGSRKSQYNEFIRETAIAARAGIPEGPLPFESAVSGLILRSLGLGILFFVSGISAHKYWPYVDYLDYAVYLICLLCSLFMLLRSYLNNRLVPVPYME